VQVETVLVASMCVGKGLDVGEGTNLVVCYSDMNLQTAENLMLPAGLHQLPVVTRLGIQWQDRGHKLVGLLHRESITPTIRWGKILPISIATSLCLHNVTLYQCITITTHNHMLVFQHLSFSLETKVSILPYAWKEQFRGSLLDEDYRILTVAIGSSMSFFFPITSNCMFAQEYQLSAIEKQQKLCKMIVSWMA
jgi:hypothetical protein